MLVGALGALSNQRGAGRPVDLDTLIGNVSANLVARWRLGSDGTEIVNGLDATVNNAPSFGQADLAPLSNDGAVLLDGSTQYLDLSDDALLHLSEGEVVVWCKPDTLHDGALWSKDATGNNAEDLTLRLTAAGAILAFGDDGVDQIFAQSAGGYYSAGQQLYVSMAFGGGQNLQVCENAVVVGEADDPGYTGDIATQTNPLLLGRAGYGSTHFFDGVVDEIMIFDGRLTPDERRRLGQIGPVAKAGTIPAGEPTDPATNVDLRSNSESLTSSSFSEVSKTENFGTFSLNGDTLTYTPSNSGTGTDTYTYKVTDSIGEDQAQLSFTVATASADIPVGADWYWDSTETASNAANWNSIAATNDAKSPRVHEIETFDTTNDLNARILAADQTPTMVESASGDIPAGAMLATRVNTDPDRHTSLHPEQVGGDGSTFTTITSGRLMAEHQTYGAGCKFYLEEFPESTIMVQQVAGDQGAGGPWFKIRISTEGTLSIVFSGDSRAVPYTSGHEWEFEDRVDTPINTGQWYKVEWEFVIDPDGLTDGKMIIKLDDVTIYDSATDAAGGNPIQLGPDGSSALVTPRFGIYYTGSNPSTHDPLNVYFDKMWMEER